MNRRRRIHRALTVEELEPRVAPVAGLAAYDVDPFLISPAWFESIVASSVQAAYGLSLFGEQSPEQIPPKEEALDFQQDEWIVQLSSAAMDGVARPSDTLGLFSNSDLGIEVVRGLGMAGQLLVRTAGASADAVTSWFSSNSDIAYFGPNTILTADLIPNDSSFSQLWGLNNTGQTGGTADADIDAPEAWEIATGGGGIVVGVIDTGVDYTHPDLSANIWTNPGEIPNNGVDDDGNGFVDDVHGYDFVNNDGDPMDDNNHGTHVSGTIAGVGNNGAGVAGVNWSSSIMALKFLNSSGSGSGADAIRALNYATMMRTTYGVNIRLTNNSWGGGGFSQSLMDAIQASGDAGMLFIAAAGNNGSNNDVTPFYPANYNLDCIISVAATDYNDAFASFSDYGATTVDLAAPGVSIYSTIAGGGYAWGNGTSMATPHVSGVAALLWSTAPDESPDRVRDAILAGVDPISSLSGKTVTGGRLNARGALDNFGMNVAASQPGMSEVVSAAPTDFTIDFTHDYDASTVDAGDLTVNGLPSDSFALDDGNTITFHFNVSPASSEGPQNMEMAAGAIMSAGDGDPVTAWQAVFYYDALPMAVTSTSPSEGQTLSAAPAQIVLDFNEAIDPASVGLNDLTLSQGVVTDATVVDSDTVAYTVSNLTNEGNVTYTLRRGALWDTHGSPGPEYVGAFVIDDPLLTRYVSSNVPKNIIDLSTITSTLTINDSVTIADLDVELDITHTWDSDLDVYLIAPNGTRIELFTDVGGGGHNFTGTILDDEAATAITSGSAPFTGRYRPEGLLSVVDGWSTLGVWTLEIGDDYGADTGKLNSWSLVVTADAGPPPTADLAYPLAGSTVYAYALNGEGYIDVTFNDMGGSGLNTATILDAGAEFSLSGSAAGGVSLNGSPTLVAGATYRYAFTGSFGTGEAYVDFLAGTWADMAGAVNAAEQESFWLVEGQSIPCNQDFSTGKPGKSDGWEYYSSTSGGRTEVVDGALRMDSDGAYCLNEAILRLDLTGASNLQLEFDHRDSKDEFHALPDQGSDWGGAHQNGDGVAISDDGGTTWRTLLSLGRNDNWATYTIDLDQEITAAGMSYTPNFLIKFQQYDNGSWGVDGREFDNISVTITHPPIDYTQDFSSGKPGASDGWEYYSSSAGGRVQVVDGALRMDSDGTNSLNEAILHLDLTGQNSVQLQFRHRDSKDEADAMPAATWTGHRNGDGVAISDDGGITWYSIASLGREADWTLHKINLDQALAATGMSYTSDFLIKFQQYDNHWWGLDGREFDDISVKAVAFAPIDYAQHFSSGKPKAADGWEYYSSAAAGRIEVVNGALRMDSNGTNSLNEAVLRLDLTGQSNVQLQFRHRDSKDEADAMPTGTWTEHRNGDGLAISSDGGATWFTILSLGREADWTLHTINLDQQVAAAGMSYTSNFLIKLQQYDNGSWGVDGREFDDVSVRAV